MKSLLAFIRGLLWLWCCLFALGTLLTVIFAPLFVPAALFLKWLWA